MANRCKHENYTEKPIERCCGVSTYKLLLGGKGPCGEIYTWFTRTSCECGVWWESTINDDCGRHGRGPHEYGVAKRKNCYDDNQLTPNEPGGGGGRREFWNCDFDMNKLMSHSDCASGCRPYRMAKRRRFDGFLHGCWTPNSQTTNVGHVRQKQPSRWELLSTLLRS